jgi:two-component system chemotaxis response regulator CheY
VVLGSTTLAQKPATRELTPGEAEPDIDDVTLFEGRGEALNKKVIIVDDSRTARQQVKLALSGSGYEIVEAVDGRDGISKIDEHRDASLVLCDVNMPNMSGLDMLGAVRDQGKAGGMQFLMLTTEAEPALLQRAKQSGARGWIVKPFKPDLLLAAVRKLVGEA